MLSILDVPASEPAASPPPEQDPEVQAQPQPEPVEFEIVLGRAQIASWIFVGLIAIAMCSSLAYLAGKSAGPRKAPPPIAEVKPALAEAKPPAAPAPLPAASIVMPPKADLPTMLKTTANPNKALFAEPETGQVYIQIGAVERGMAMILAEGLRSHGFDAFVATGPSEKIFRVLIGPLPDPDSFRQAKAAVDAIDLATYARKYEK
jgi:cell division septation protein DedD